ncbi:nucleotidyltransferase domain-containing protein [Paenibacillus doosanensis]|uniref:Nucleotidyltransferase n=1 Tax=Paenibacillus konkukensis TaxID=2020716 RepID=A0ABY4RUK4_9BACL|nr:MULTISPECIES: nucleotidyltransferase domain-containing protein [Paenibacillus]MCS7461053.1 nucleotidyltransferase domain-containing protein [Paenibacillus doosanensis]UQZ85727.1 putative nucleotidyltransferase [Paenibacillus konkukensis]
MTQRIIDRSTIIGELERIEREEGVRVLYACESGSRAWGFPSKDSDYDVRFLYIRPLEWYVSIFEWRDVIERPISDQLDISGWDLKKALNLFRKSNPPLLEWLQSPIRYAENYSVAERIRSLSPLAFSPKSCAYHYLHMAKRNYRDYLQGERVKIKKYFYVLRPVFACEWIERYGTMPPMEFDRLTDRLLAEDSRLKQAVDALLVRKKAGDELDLEPRIQPINDYLEERIAHFEQSARHMADNEGSRDRQLDELFRSALREVWGIEAL